MSAGLLKHTQTASGKKIIGKSLSRYVRCAPRKVRLVADLIRGKSVEEAYEILAFTQRPSAQPYVLKTVKAAVASAGEFHPEPETLYIEEIIIDEAPMIKRIRPASMGRAVRIRKRNSHIYVALTE